MPNFLRPPEQRGYPEGLSEVTTKQGDCGVGFSANQWQSL